MKWVLGEIHPIYGKVQMMASLSGEAYRWFIKGNLVSMIPLSCLEAENEQTIKDKKVGEKRIYNEHDTYAGGVMSVDDW